MKPEEQRLRHDLIERFGEREFSIALELAGLRVCLMALAAEGMGDTERRLAHERASAHIAKVLECLVPPGRQNALTECTQRIASALEVWTMDDLEERQGLPNP